MKNRHLLSIALGVAAFAAACGELPSGSIALPDGAAGLNISGAIYTTSSGCTGVNVNQFPHKDSVYLDGGPQNDNAAGLPPGAYWVQVTDPSGATVLGTSSGATAIVGSDGRFVDCYHLSSILYRASNGTPGYDDTPNADGVYKVWISTTDDFANNASKTDNFIVQAPPPPPDTWLHVRKFYDANANGQMDVGEVFLTGWRVDINGTFAFTDVDLLVQPGTFTITESSPVETNWMGTTANPVVLNIPLGDTQTATFGNLCLGAGGGLTLGFWSNKNGAALYGAGDNAYMVSLNLRNAAGAHFDPTGHAQFRSWILSATATNMAYMLSAQMAAAALNVYNGNVNGASLIYAPGTTSANSLGFASISAVIAEANASLGTDGVTVAAGPTRTYQEALKNALDRANNNLNFVQATACPFSFPI